MTLVFTDVEGSTAIWERAPEVMREALAIHDEVLRSTLERVGGYEVKTAGDSFMAAFHEPEGAVRWCLAAQASLLDAPWPPGLAALPEAVEVRLDDGALLHRGLRVRMGVHAGAAEARRDPRSARWDYFGPSVNRAARIAAAAHGGQVLLSEEVWRAVRPALEARDRPAVVELGEHRFQGLSGPVGVVQVLPSALGARRFPPLRASSRPRPRLPASVDSFVGRRSELRRIRDCVARGCRLVTLTGPGGIGKTRLALHFAALDPFRRAEAGGVWFSDLSAASSTPEVVAGVAAALEVPLAASAAPEEGVERCGAAMAARGACLVLVDNFEQAAAAAAETVGRWLDLAPEAVFLVTSRERLGLRGETVIELGPLGLPDGAMPAFATEAVQLLLQRARAVRADYASGPGDFEHLAEVARVLDGIPLAIELAAARAGLLAPAALRERLARGLDLLGGAGRGRPARHATLRATIDWSWGLLSPWEREAFLQCTVFRGGFTVEAAEAVVDLSAWPASPPVIEVLQSLRDRSLLCARTAPAGPRGGPARLGMYGPIGDYGRERARLSGSPLEAVEARHAAYYLALGERLAPLVPGGGAGAGLPALAAEVENLRAVLGHAFRQHPGACGTVEALRAALALDAVLTLRGPASARGDLLRAVVSRAEAIGDAPVFPPGLLGRAYEARGRARLMEADERGAAADFQHGLELAHEAGDRLLEGVLLRDTGHLARSRQDRRVAAARYEESLAVLRDLGDRLGEGHILCELSALWAEAGELGRAMGYATSGLELAREQGDGQLEALQLMVLGGLHQEAGRLAEAESCLSDGIEAAGRLGLRREDCLAQGYLGMVHQEGRVWEKALACYEAAVRVAGEVGDRHYRRLFGACLGGCLAQAGRLEEAGAALAAAEGEARPGEHPILAVVASLQRGLCEVALARELAERGLAEEASRQLHSPRARLAAKGATSDEVRFAARLLASALAGVGPRRHGV